MKRYLFLVLFGFLFLLNNAEAQSVKVFRKADFQFKDQTYRFKDGIVCVNRDTLRNHDWDNIMQASFDANNYQHKISSDPESGTLIFTYIVGIQSMSDYSFYGNNIKMPNGFFGKIKIENPEMPISTMMLILVDIKTKEVVWAATAQGGYASKDRLLFVENVFRSAFIDFPNVGEPIPNYEKILVKPLPPSKSYRPVDGAEKTTGGKSKSYNVLIEAKK